MQVALRSRPNSDATRQCIRFQQLLLPDRGARLPGTTTGHNWLKERPFLAPELFRRRRTMEYHRIFAIWFTGEDRGIPTVAAFGPSPKRRCRQSSGGTYRSMVASPACRQCRCHRIATGKNGDFAEVWSAGSLELRHV